MDLLQEAKRGNRVFQITLPNGESIPFRLLTWGDFNVYWDALKKGVIPQDVLEWAIFRQCALQEYDVSRADNMRAGIVSTVTNLIMQMSGPVEMASFNDTMDMMRQHTNSMHSSIVMLVCRAFPSYTPEDIEEMPWNKVLLRVAQAEAILMSKNPPEIESGLYMMSPEELDKEKRGKKVNADDLVRDGRQFERAVGDGSVEPNMTPDQLRQSRQVQQLMEKRRQADSDMQRKAQLLSQRKR